MLVSLGMRRVNASVVSALIPVSCNSENTNEVFKYNITCTENYNNSAKLLTDSLYLSGNTSSTFGVNVSVAGKYSFEVYQDKGTDTDTKYDSTIYTVDVYVTEDDEGNLASEVIAYVKGSNDKVDSCSFRNIKSLPEVTTKVTRTHTDYTSYGKDYKTTPVKTSDDTNIPKWVWICSGSLLVILICIRSRIRRG